MTACYVLMVYGKHSKPCGARLTENLSRRVSAARSSPADLPLDGTHSRISRFWLNKTSNESLILNLVGKHHGLQTY
jgi:hypothetical protein